MFPLPTAVSVRMLSHSLFVFVEILRVSRLSSFETTQRGNLVALDERPRRPDIPPFLSFVSLSLSVFVPLAFPVQVSRQGSAISAI